MLYINSIAAVAGSVDASSLVGGRGCRTILKKKYIADTLNSNPSQARFNTEISSSELGAMAAKQALERAGLEAEDLKLLIGDTITPLELIPSESQRVAKELGVKVASYDIGTSGAGMPVLLESMSKWKSDRLEGPILVVVVNTPSLAYDFSNQDQPAVVGDAALAFVVSNKVQGFSLESVTVDTYRASDAMLSVPINGHLVFKGNFQDRLSGICSSLAEKLNVQSVDKVVVSDFGLRSLDKPNVSSVSSKYGESLGASLGLAYEEIVDLRKGQTLGLLAPGCGVFVGGCVLKKV